MAFNFNVQEFRSQLAFDGARPSLFNITMACPPQVSLPGVNQQITFKARAASLPGDSISSIVVNYFGREVKVAGTRTFPEWTMTVINDEDFTIRNTFEKWMAFMNAHVSNIRQPAFINGVGNITGAGYTTDVVIDQFSKAGPAASAVPALGAGPNGQIKSYTLRGAFPTDLSPIDLNWGDGDTIEEFTITFAYQWWQSASVAQAEI